MSYQDQCGANAVQKPGGNTINKSKRQHNLLHDVFFPGHDEKLVQLS